MKHTPGPWTTGPGRNNTIAVVARGWETPLVANVSAKGRSIEEANANADLIAAAPELTDFARRFLMATGKGVSLPHRLVDQFIDAARAALKKAGIAE